MPPHSLLVQRYFPCETHGALSSVNSPQQDRISKSRFAGHSSKVEPVTSGFKVAIRRATPVLMQPIPGSILRHVREMRPHVRPPLFKRLFDAAPGFKSRLQVFRVIVHKADVGALPLVPSRATKRILRTASFGASLDRPTPGLRQSVKGDARHPLSTGRSIDGFNLHNPTHSRADRIFRSHARAVMSEY